MKNSTILEDLKWRYATKKFDSARRLEESHLSLLKEAFNLTATSYGLQPCKMVVVKNKQLKESMVEHSYGQRQVADCSEVLVICTQLVDSEYISRYFDLVKNIRQTPEEVLKPFEDFLKDSFSQKSLQEVELWSRNQAYLILGNLLTVCAAQKIDSCPMEGFVPEKIDELLGLNDKGMKSILLLPVGYRAADDYMSSEKKVRKNLADSILVMD